jgi:hypothetical protein
MASPTTIYLTPKQRKGLFRRARKRKTSFSEEVRAALDLYLQFPPDFEEERLAALVREANASMDRSIGKLDEAIAFCKQTMERINELERR